MYRSDLSGFVNLCRVKQVPLTEDGQNQLLQAIRFAVWNKRYDELQHLFMACGMFESEIIARKYFYRKFAALMTRMLVLLPQLHQYFMLAYIAEDMIDGGDSELVIAGKRFSAAMEHAKTSAKDIRGQINMPALPDFTEAQLNHYQKFPGEFIADFIEPGWEYDSDRSYGLAIAAEILALDPEDVPHVEPMLIGAIGDFRSREEFFFTFTMTTSRLLANAGFDNWVPVWQKIFSPLCGSCRTEAGREPADNAVADVDYGPLELTAISRAWKTEGLDRAMELARERLALTPDDAFACGMLGNIYLAQMNIPLALACLCRAFWLAPDSALVIHTLGQAFQAGYFAHQVDLCRARLQRLPECKARPDQFRFGVELFIKCDQEGTQASVDGHAVGCCPLQLNGIRPGQHQILWQLPDGRQKRFAVELEDATIAKYRYHPDSGRVSDEISRTGSVTLFTADGPTELGTLVAAYLVDDLQKLPHPTVEECVGSSLKQ